MAQRDRLVHATKAPHRNILIIILKTLRKNLLQKEPTLDKKKIYVRLRFDTVAFSFRSLNRFWTVQ